MFETIRDVCDDFQVHFAGQTDDREQILLSNRDFLAEQSTRIFETIRDVADLLCLRVQ
jgi:hypothetical protein